MTHYICEGGCKGVSNVAKKCEAIDCPHKGVDLKSCDCKDGKHFGAFEKDLHSFEDSEEELK